MLFLFVSGTLFLNELLFLILPEAPGVVAGNLNRKHGHSKMLVNSITTIPQTTLHGLALAPIPPVSLNKLLTLRCAHKGTLPLPVQPYSKLTGQWGNIMPPP